MDQPVLMQNSSDFSGAAVQQQPAPGQHNFMPAPGGAYGHNTTVVINQPAPVIVGNRAWSSGVCGCLEDASSCVMGLFCPCVQASQIAMDMGESCCVPWCVPSWLVVLRTKLRTSHKIQGSVMDDCFIASCCGPCIQCQMAREIKYIQMTNGRPGQIIA